ncbi:hypothetical protein [Natrarchaeobius oligotrophus]|uniref:hypothetical protein n=1 Tax=Natrarchaeobius oligotrophus TaxID=3455743 RepID=UPI001FB1BB07|nr:hypothetical protein [Natrarchaeobius chitinivorans]
MGEVVLLDVALESRHDVLVAFDLRESLGPILLDPDFGPAGCRLRRLGVGLAHTGPRSGREINRPNDGVDVDANGSPTRAWVWPADSVGTDRRSRGEGKPPIGW